MEGLPERADELYGLGLDRFVAERDALAKELRGAGDREAADRVKGLAKPTVAAGAVNLAVRGHAEEARELAEAAHALADAQQQMLDGGDRAALRVASERARAAVDALVAHADGGAATLEKVRATLLAATLDPEAGEEVAAGRVVREREASGFGGLAIAPAGDAPKRRPPRETEDRTEDAATADEEAEAAVRAQREAAAAAERARREYIAAADAQVAQAESALAAARGELQAIEAEAATVRERVADAEEAAGEARRLREQAGA